MVSKKRRAAAIFLLLSNESDEPQRKKRIWSYDYLLRRETLGCHHTLLNELRLEVPQRYKQILRMAPETFDMLAEMVTPHIEKATTTMRNAIPPAERLALTLHYLATGRSYVDLGFQYRVSDSAVGRIVPETCRAIYQVLKDDYLKVPSTPDQWLQIATGYETKWNCPHIIGAVDGKHVRIRKPKQSGSDYWCYKGFDSVVLMAVAGPDLQVLYADVGRPGRSSDGGTWNECTLKAELDKGTMGLPSDSTLPGGQNPVPYVLVGDAAFTAKPYLIKPYPDKNLTHEKRITNYRLSRARRCVENTFGLLNSSFGVYQSPLAQDPKTVIDIVWATLALHNLLRNHKPSIARYCPPGHIDVEDINTGTVRRGDYRSAPRTALQDLRLSSGRLSKSAGAVREEFHDYFNGDGAVPWQRRSAGLE